MSSAAVRDASPVAVRSAEGDSPAGNHLEELVPHCAFGRTSGGGKAWQTPHVARACCSSGDAALACTPGALLNPFWPAATATSVTTARAAAIVSALTRVCPPIFIRRCEREKSRPLEIKTVDVRLVEARMACRAAPRPPSLRPYPIEPLARLVWPTANSPVASARPAYAVRMT